MKLRSLHARLIAGAAIWSAGLLAAVFAVGLAVIKQRPAWALLVHNGFLIVSAVVLVTAGISVIRGGLSPFRMLRERLAAVRDGRAARSRATIPRRSCRSSTISTRCSTSASGGSHARLRRPATWRTD